MKKLLLFVMLSIATLFNAQSINNDIKANVKVYLNNEYIETDSVLVTFSEIDVMHVYSKITNDFTTYLLPNRQYKITIAHPHYTNQVIRVITSNVDNINININLTKNNNTSIITYKYDDSLKRYIATN